MENTPNEPQEELTSQVSQLEALGQVLELDTSADEQLVLVDERQEEDVEHQLQPEADLQFAHDE